jgi:OmpA-OmpF porin, OOP family
MKTFLTTLAATILLCVAGVASAQPYLWGGLGSAKADVRTSPDASGSDTGAFQLGAGWRFNKFFAVEAGYLDLPSYDGLTPSLNAFWTANGHTLAAIGNVPLGASWSLVGKLGVWDAKSELKVVAIPAGTTTVTKTDLGSRPMIGAGVEFHTGPHFRLRAIYEQIQGKDTLELDKVRLFTLGMVVQF